MKMKWNEKRNLGALALAIALALGGSPAVQAMPQGGTVASGDVSGLSDGTVSSGGTLTANSNSIINWDSFSIGKGESLTLNTANYAMLNRVTGTSLSELFGTLNQTGENMALLINPNGITVGSSGIINSQNLILSTLAISDTDYQSLVSGGTGTFATPSGRSIGAPVTFESGATVNATDVYDIEYSSPFSVYGGTINVADGVTFTSTGHTPGMDFIAANSYLDGVSPSNTKLTATPANTIQFSGKVDCTNTENESYLNLIGGAVNLDGADITLSSHDKTYYSSEVDLVAVNRFGNSNSSETVSFDRASGNTVTLKNTKISADGLYIAAGSASKNDGTTLSIGSDGTNLLTGIGTGTYTDGAAGTGSWSAWSDSTSSSGTSGSASSSSGTSSGTSGSSEVSTSDTVSSTTGDVLTDATVQATKATESASKTDTSTSLFSDEEEAPVQVHDSGNSSTTPGAVAGRPGAVDDRTAPALSATVLSAIEQGNAQFESFVHQNIHDGYMAMEGILRASTSPEQRMAGASTLVNRIDSDKTLDEGAKLAQAYGMIQAVNDNATMSEDEKKALRKMIASNFRSLSSGVKTYLASVAASAAKRNA
ncbi:filamentous hemagglutinin N-terminal domain-containing protein [uncultured Selenomonas sp.]|uniref:two-partner secretion domain-containing protein n=1 Tax=uncultured Selenomonas sp. TaxID=159275 RepID=UPI0025CBE39B|nr:filamentous hemagglutinin N-terminal domain-containing protein [uncultured Selenomonas sp.]